MSNSRFEQYLQKRSDVLGLRLTSAHAEMLWRYYELLGKWNGTTNLTAHDLSRLDESTLERIIVEPLTAAIHVDGLIKRWIDLGSGGGSPAIPMKILLPEEIHLTMTEARFKKAAFLREAVRTLGLRNIEVHSGRFEELCDPPGRFDLATSRAVRLDGPVSQALHRCLKPGGLLLSFGHQSGDLRGFNEVASQSDPSIFARP